jgi:DNA-binding MarR family transcriptional regulator
LFTIIFGKPLDKSPEVWYNIVRKRGEKPPREREEKIMTNEHQAILNYLADGKRRSVGEIASWIGVSIPRASALCTELLERKAIKVGPHRVFNKVVLDYYSIR